MKKAIGPIAKWVQPNGGPKQKAVSNIFFFFGGGGAIVGRAPFMMVLMTVCRIFSKMKPYLQLTTG
jgi:hypothetical protein